MENNDAKKVNTLTLVPAIINSLPPQARRILRVLEKEGNVVIKGGTVKLVAMALLEKKGQFKDHERFVRESRIKDIDLDFIVVGSLAAMQRQVIEKFHRLEQYFQASEMYLNARDIELIEAESWEKGIEAIMGRNDLAMNELAMDYFNGRWHFYYTQRACRNLIEGVGVLNPKPGHILYDAGRIFASPLGIIRLVKFLVTGKVKKIYLPKYWLELYSEYYQKKVKSGEMPPNAPLGFYSLVLMKNYFGDDPQLQKKALVALYDLGFTEILDPDLYIRQQESIFANTGNYFEQVDFTIEEIISRYFQAKQKREENRKNRHGGQAACEHEFETIECDRCGQNRCVIETCAKCGKNKDNAFLPCVLRMRAGETDPNGFYRLK